MKGRERIPVYIDFENGTAVCICHQDRKMCNRPCEKATVERDRYEGWRQTMNTSRYGPKRRYRDDD